VIYKVSDILNKLEHCIVNKKPFSHIRFGDGGIKFLHAMLFDDGKQLGIISKREGLPAEKLNEIFELWGYFARQADFIDTPEVYFNGNFWPRMRTPHKGMTIQTEERMRMWKDLYHRSEFDNENYCNPESNYLMVVKMGNHKNLLNMMGRRKVCIITARPEVKKVLRGYDVDVIEIVGHYKNQYKNSFGNVIDIIKESAKRYDFWLVAAGELGRIYTGTIKENGGRAIDIGFVIEFWLGTELHPRLELYLKRKVFSPLELTLTQFSHCFSGAI
jgi:hypothetical protein